MPPDETTGASHEHASPHAPPLFFKHSSRGLPGSITRRSGTGKVVDSRPENDKGLHSTRSRSGKLEEGFSSIAVKLADARGRCPSRTHLRSFRAANPSKTPSTCEYRFGQAERYATGLRSPLETYEGAKPPLHPAWSWISRGARYHVSPPPPVASVPCGVSSVRRSAYRRGSSRSSASSQGRRPCIIRRPAAFEEAPDLLEGGACREEQSRITSGGCRPAKRSSRRLYSSHSYGVLR